MAQGTGPLSGLRVVDVTWAAAGPFSTQILALLGAEVIKVETATRPDLFRRVVGRPELGLDHANRFNAINLNKKSFQLNLKSEAGRHVFRQLISHSDALVENFRPGVLARLCLDYESLTEARGDLVMLSISSAGHTGPDREQPGYAPIFNAMGGLGFITGYPDGPPTEVRDSLDLRIATAGAFALVLALLHWQRTGEGQWVDVSGREVTASLIGDAFVEHSITGLTPWRMGNSSGVPFAVPYEVFPCEGDDSWIAVAVTNDEEWQALCAAMARSDLASDPRFADRVGRHEHKAECNAIVSDWTKSMKAATVALLCRRYKVPSSVVHSASSLLADEHIRERNVIREVEHPHLGRQRVVGSTWTVGVAPELVASPLLGADNPSILQDLLGYDDNEISDLQRLGAFE